MFADDAVAPNLFDASHTVGDDPVPALQANRFVAFVGDPNGVYEEPVPIDGIRMFSRVAGVDRNPDPVGNGLTRAGRHVSLTHGTESSRRFPGGKSERRVTPKSRYSGRMPIRAVVFDLFDTLVDLSMEDLPRVQIRGREYPSTMGALHEAVREAREISFDDFADALIDVDLRHRETHYEKHRELPTRERFRVLCDEIDLPHSDFVERLTSVHMGMVHSCASTPGHHVDVMSDLAQKARLGLCSNFTDSATARRILVESGLADTLHSLVISEDVGVRKPHPEIFEAILGELGVSPQEALHVGDNLSADVVGASRVGIRTVWITRRIKDPAAALDRHEGPEPDWQIHDLSELADLLD